MKKKPTKAKKITKVAKARAKFQAKAVGLYESGRKVADIAVAVGYARGSGQNRVASALIKAGVYKGQRAN